MFHLGDKQRESVKNRKDLSFDLRTNLNAWSGLLHDGFLPFGKLREQ